MRLNVTNIRYLNLCWTWPFISADNQWLCNYLIYCCIECKFEIQLFSYSVSRYWLEVTPSTNKCNCFSITQSPMQSKNTGVKKGDFSAFAKHPCWIWNFRVPFRQSSTSTFLKDVKHTHINLLSSSFFIKKYILQENADNCAVRGDDLLQY
jgi:hypothetical protein